MLLFIVLFPCRIRIWKQETTHNNNDNNCRSVPMTKMSMQIDVTKEITNSDEMLKKKVDAVKITTEPTSPALTYAAAEQKFEPTIQMIVERLCGTMVQVLVY